MRAPTWITVTTLINVSRALTLLWQFESSGAGDSQIRSELQHSIDGGTWQTTTVAGNINGWTFPANFFPGAANFVTFRVRTISSFGTSPYSAQRRMNTYGGGDVTISPVLGVHFDNIENSVWREVPASSTNLVIGRRSLAIFLGGIIFNLPDLRGARLSRVTLRVRLESQPLIHGSGALSVGPYVYTGISSARVVDAHRVSGIAGTAQFVVIDVTSSSTELFLGRQIGYSLAFHPNTTTDGFIRANYSQCTLSYEVEPWDGGNPSRFRPTNLTPSSGTIPANVNNLFSWRYVPTEHPDDAQLGSFFQYSVDLGNWRTMELGAPDPNFAPVNFFDIPAGTFPQGATVRWRVSTISNIIGASEFSDFITLQTHSTTPPTALSPDGTNRNPRGHIELTWQFEPGSHRDAEQFNSEIRYRVNNGAWEYIIRNDALNTHEFQPNTFAAGNTVSWQVRTVSSSGESGWSETASFLLAPTPPLAPSPVFPVGISVPPIAGVFLTWNYNSPYDQNPSRFDLEYRINQGAWVTARTDGAVSFLLGAELFPEEQSTVEWRVGIILPPNILFTYYLLLITCSLNLHHHLSPVRHHPARP